VENTKQLRDWIRQKVESEYDGNLTAFAENTAVSRQTWMNILRTRYRSLRQQAVDDLCDLFELTEIDLYRIAHAEVTDGDEVQESPAAYRPKDDAERLAGFLRRASKKDRDFIFSAAERCGFKRRNESNRRE
jgi:hypothetical protein